MINLLIFIATFIFMEGVAWFTHKYVMHGLLWNLHEDHHQPVQGHRFEKNDSFFVIFAVPAMLSFGFGVSFSISALTAIGAGITLYGFCYFLVHDVFIHQRFKWLKRSNNLYLRAIRKAHKIHHKHLDRHDGECFGMLWVPWKYFRAELKRKRNA